MRNMPTKKGINYLHRRIYGMPSILHTPHGGGRLPISFYFTAHLCHLLGQIPKTAYSLAQWCQFLYVSASAEPEASEVGNTVCASRGPEGTSPCMAGPAGKY